MERFHEIKIAGQKRKLPICKVNDKISIAAFILFSDVKLTIACAKALLNKVPEFDIILCPEAKSIPLAYEMSRQSKKKYFVARKSVKIYTPNPVSSQVISITTNSVQNLYLDKSEGEVITRKRVLLVDDVVSTGKTLLALESMLKNFGAVVAAKCAVLAEGAAAERKDIIYLNRLPLFENSDYED